VQCARAKFNPPTPLDGESDGVFHAPQNLEKGGHGISPRTMHRLKILFAPAWKALSFAYSAPVVET
jgi:hypothetical protein